MNVARRRPLFFELRGKSQVNMWSFGICLIVKGACRKCFCCGTLLSARARSKTSEGGKQRVASPIGTDALLLVLKSFICEHAGGFGHRSRRVLRLQTMCGLLRDILSLHYFGQHGPHETFMDVWRKRGKCPQRSSEKRHLR